MQKMQKMKFYEKYKENWKFTSFSFISTSFDGDIETFKGVNALNLVFFLRLLNISFAMAISFKKT